MKIKVELDFDADSNRVVVKKKIRQNLRILNILPPKKCGYDVSIFTTSKGLPDVEYQPIEKTSKQIKKEIAEFGHEIEEVAPTKKSKIYLYHFSAANGSDSKFDSSKFLNVRLDTRYNKNLGVEVRKRLYDPLNSDSDKNPKKGKAQRKSSFSVHILYQEVQVDERLFKNHDFKNLIRSEEDLVKDERFEDLLSQLESLREIMEG